MNTQNLPKRRGRPKKDRAVEPVIKEIVEDIPPMTPDEKKDMETLLVDLKKGEAIFVGEWRGHGPSYELARDYALALEGACHPEQFGKIEKQYREKRKTVSEAQLDGWKRAKNEAAERDEQLLERHRGIVELVKSEKLTIYRAATILLSKPEVTESIATLRRRISRIVEKINRDG